MKFIIPVDISSIISVTVAPSEVIALGITLMFVKVIKSDLE
ncbi:hypothetical protein AB5N96_07050 [Chryseomicrobium imtechense]